MALFLVGQNIGVEKAKVYQLLIEYDPNPAFDSGTIIKSDEATICLTKKYSTKKPKRIKVY